MPRTQVKRYLKWLVVLLAALAIILLPYVVVRSIAPSDFPDKEIVKIDKNMYLSQAADVLAENHIIKSPLLFKVYATLLGGSKKIIADSYMFDEPESTIRVAYRLIHGQNEMPKIKVTIPEGVNSMQIAAIMKQDIPGFDADSFKTLAKGYEGYLFPDTYYFYPTVTPEEVVQTLRNTFIDKTRSLASEINDFNRPYDDVITMASIVEREANNETDRRIIAGILWKRIDEGMALQVDPPFVYAFGHNTFDITVKDLASSSPYNTYKHKGLPPTPVSNPSLSAIEDTVNPVDTDYYFYLSDANGVTHFAKTGSAQLANKAKYIDQN